jgi:hypothetical protein
MKHCTLCTIHKEMLLHALAADLRSLHMLPITRAKIFRNNVKLQQQFLFQPHAPICTRVVILRTCTLLYRVAAINPEF